VDQRLSRRTVNACLQQSVCIYRHNLDFSLGQFPKFASLIA
jgi:hypothetical protein